MEQTCRSFTLSEIQSLTHNFDEAFVVGRGGFGKVYKGQIDGSSNFVAIKRSNSMSNQGAPEFRAEIEMLSKLRHCNLVSLIGYCNEGREMVLVYEYMPHGTLADHLHREGSPLSWLQRLKICVGAARGLDYLHTGTGTQHGIIHRDVKTSNILLDENFAAKISDFGLAKVGPTNQTLTFVSTAVKGTFGYMDPCYFYTGKLTRKSDVYSFGVVLLEVICGRPAVDTSLDETQWGLAPWAQEKIKQGKLDHIIDYRLKGQISRKCMKDFARIASNCLNYLPDKRPTMADIVSKLHVILSAQERLDSSITEGKFMDKVIFFFSSKVESKPNNLILDPAPISSSKDAPSNKADADDRVDERRRRKVRERRRRRKKHGTGKNSSDQLPASTQRPIDQSELTLKLFSYTVLKSATRNFRPDGFLGEDSHGLVYKGWIDELSIAAAKPGTGIVVAVKRLKGLELKERAQLLAEIDYLGQLKHPNLVKLIGCCLEGHQRLLVYEFMPGGSLEQHLFSGDPTKPIPWNLRMKVIQDVARGLAYIHHQKLKVTLDHINSSSILFDSNHNARISKFWSLLDPESYVSAHFPGKTSEIYQETHRYDAPEFIFTGRVTRKSQIYSFGVVILELLTGMRYFDRNNMLQLRNLLDFSNSYLTDKQRILEIIDSCMDGQYSPREVIRLADIARKCILENPFGRPTADELLEALEELQDLKNPIESNPREES